jgi:hypothetical protein
VGLIASHAFGQTNAKRAGSRKKRFSSSATAQFSIAGRDTARRNSAPSSGLFASSRIFAPSVARRVSSASVIALMAS